MPGGHGEAGVHFARRHPRREGEGAEEHAAHRHGGRRSRTGEQEEREQVFLASVSLFIRGGECKIVLFANQDSGLGDSS